MEAKNTDQTCMSDGLSNQPQLVMRLIELELMDVSKPFSRVAPHTTHCNNLNGRLESMDMSHHCCPYRAVACLATSAPGTMMDFRSPSNGTSDVLSGSATLSEQATRQRSKNHSLYVMYSYN